MKKFGQMNDFRSIRFFIILLIVFINWTTNIITFSKIKINICKDYLLTLKKLTAGNGILFLILQSNGDKNEYFLDS
jgi:hypothetical protein